jgi:Uma2 family endonuclease
MAIVDGITIEEFERLPAALARNHELVNGQLVDVSGDTAGHHLLRDFLLVLLLPFVRERKLGTIICGQGFDFDGNAHAPDVSFIGAAKLHLIDGKRRVQLFVPDLAIEIVSESDTFNGLMGKVLRYRRSGTKEVWMLLPDTRLGFVLSEERQIGLTDDQMFESKLIPGFSIRLGELFDKADD